MFNDQILILFMNNEIDKILSTYQDSPNTYPTWFNDWSEMENGVKEAHEKYLELKYEQKRLLEEAEELERYTMLKKCSDNYIPTIKKKKDKYSFIRIIYKKLKV